jgi:hypothetical protein
MHTQSRRSPPASFAALGTQPSYAMVIVRRAANGQPRTYRHLAPAPATTPAAAYRRLAIAMLGLDVRTLARELTSASHHPASRAA